MIEHICQADVNADGTYYGEKRECDSRCSKPARFFFDTGFNQFWLCAEHYDRMLTPDPDNEF